MEQHYSPRTAAQRLDVPVKTLMYWLHTGKLRGVKMGKLWKIPESAIQEFIEASTANPAQVGRREPDAAKERARMLDEGLAVLDRLWSGEMVTHHGQHYDVENVSLAPLPFQRPRIPIWIGGESPPALRRAARWDGWLAPATSPDGIPIMDKDPWRIAEMVAEIRRHRTTDTPFAVAVDGYSDPGDPTLPHAYQVAGATWWLESIHGMRGSLDEMIARVEAGPPSPR